MKKVVLLSLISVFVLIPTAVAGLTDLPNGYMGGWEGKSSYGENFGDGKIIQGHIEFAVYDTHAAGNESLSVPNNRRYLYAYQIFNNGSQATAAVNFLGIKGIKSGNVNVTDLGIGTSNKIGAAEQDGSVDTTDNWLNASRTKASFAFDNDFLGVGKKSFFLLIGSDFAPVAGQYELVESTDNGIPVTGENGSSNDSESSAIPEPATMALLMGGALIGMRKRK